MILNRLSPGEENLYEHTALWFVFTETHGWILECLWTVDLIVALGCTAPSRADATLNYMDDISLEFFI